MKVVGPVNLILIKFRSVVGMSKLSIPPMYVGEFIRTFEKPGTRTFAFSVRNPTDPSRYLAL
jgi:hypothetical protein